MRLRYLAGVSLLALMASPALAQEKLTVTSQVTIVPAVPAYVAGYCLGGVMTVPGLVRPSGTGGTIIESETIVDLSGKDVSPDIFFFKAKPTGTYTDHSTCSISAADAVNMIGLVQSASFSCSLASASTIGVCQSWVPIHLNTTPISTTSTPPVISSNVWAIAIARAATSYGTTSLYFNFQAWPD